MRTGDITGIHHVSVVVEDIRVAIAAYRGFGMSVEEPTFYPEVDMYIAFAGKGASRVELVQAAGPASPVAGHTGGLHHLALATTDIENAWRRLDGDDRYRLEGEVRQGAHSRIFFFRIVGDDTTLYECVEATP